jgi:hypothetical protein
MASKYQLKGSSFYIIGIAFPVNKLGISGSVILHEIKKVTLI